eukprot:m.94082 g.94082  ORF g.94082 m.94082 type:complete len:514 (+) comp36808_c0_seq17:357-1898(+)
MSSGQPTLFTPADLTMPAKCVQFCEEAVASDELGRVWECIRKHNFLLFAALLIQVEKCSSPVRDSADNSDLRRKKVLVLIASAYENAEKEVAKLLREVTEVISEVQRKLYWGFYASFLAEKRGITNSETEAKSYLRKMRYYAIKGFTTEKEKVLQFEAEIFKYCSFCQSCWGKFSESPCSFEKAIAKCRSACLLLDEWFKSKTKQLEFSPNQSHKEKSNVKAVSMQEKASEKHQEPGFMNETKMNQCLTNFSMESRETEEKSGSLEMKSTDSNYLERHNDNVGLFEEEAKRKKLQNESATWEETDKSGELEKNSGETEGLKREFAQEPKEQYESEEEHCAASGKTSLAGPTDSPLELFQESGLSNGNEESLLKDSGARSSLSSKTLLSANQAQQTFRFTDEVEEISDPRRRSEIARRFDDLFLSTYHIVECGEEINAETYKQREWSLLALNLFEIAFNETKSCIELAQNPENHCHLTDSNPSAQAVLDKRGLRQQDIHWIVKHLSLLRRDTVK